YARRHRDDPDRFSADFKRAWASGRPEPFISMAEALDAEGDLGVKGASRLAWRLTGAGRWARLFELLHDARYGLLGAAEGHLYLAQAELGLGRPAEALAAAKRARKLEPELRDRAVELETSAARLQLARSQARHSR